MAPRYALSRTFPPLCPPPTIILQRFSHRKQSGQERAKETCSPGFQVHPAPCLYPLRYIGQICLPFTPARRGWSSPSTDRPLSPPWYFVSSKTFKTPPLEDHSPPSHTCRVLFPPVFSSFDTSFRFVVLRQCRI